MRSALSAKLERETPASRLEDISTITSGYSLDSRGI